MFQMLRTFDLTNFKVVKEIINIAGYMTPLSHILRQSEAIPITSLQKSYVEFKTFVVFKAYIIVVL